MNEKKRIPLSENRLGEVSGGASGIEIPGWAQEAVDWYNTCPACKAKGVDGIRGRVIGFEVRIDTPNSKSARASFDCPAGHCWEGHISWNP